MRTSLLGHSCLFDGGETFEAMWSATLHSPCWSRPKAKAAPSLRTSHAEEVGTTRALGATGFLWRRKHTLRESRTKCGPGRNVGCRKPRQHTSFRGRIRGMVGHDADHFLKRPLTLFSSTKSTKSGKLLPTMGIRARWGLMPSGRSGILQRP